MPFIDNLTPHGFVRLEVGDPITADTCFRDSGVGPWLFLAPDGRMAYSLGPGDSYPEGRVPFYRPETWSEFLSRATAPHLTDLRLPPPPGWATLDGWDILPANCRSGIPPHERVRGISGIRLADQWVDSFLVPMGFPRGTPEDPGDVDAWLETEAAEFFRKHYGASLSSPTHAPFVSRKPPRGVRRAFVEALDLP